MPGPVQVALGHQLEHRIDRLRGDPGGLVQAPRVDPAHAAPGPGYRGERRPAPRVPVAGRVGDQIAVAVQQRVVHGPPVDGHRVDRDPRTVRGRGPQPGADPGEQRASVPAQHAADQSRLVGETMDLPEAETPVRSVSDDDPSAGAAQIDGRDPDRVHRRNPAVTPESTGICSPVVKDRSPAVRATTAAATWLGRTSRIGG